jgi:hypothetical protein
MDNSFMRTADSMLEKLKEIIRADSEASADPLERTPLIRLGQTIRELAPDNIGAKNFVWAIRKLAESVPAFTLKETKNLLGLIYFSRMAASDYRDAFLRMYRKWERTEDNAGQRAEIFRLLSKFEGYRFTRKDITNEEAIRRQNPWLWIDVAAIDNWDLALEETKKCLARDRNVRPVLSRLRDWWNKRGEILLLDFKRYLLESFSQEDLLKIRRWFHSVGVTEATLNRYWEGHMRTEDMIEFCSALLSQQPSKRDAADESSGDFGRVPRPDLQGLETSLNERCTYSQT